MAAAGMYFCLKRAIGATAFPNLNQSALKFGGRFRRIDQGIKRLA